MHCGAYVALRRVPGKLRGGASPNAFSVVGITHEWAIVAPILYKLLCGLDQRTRHAGFEPALRDFGGHDVVSNFLLCHGWMLVLFLTREVGTTAMAIRLTMLGVDEANSGERARVDVGCSWVESGQGGASTATTKMCCSSPETRKEFRKIVPKNNFLYQGCRSVGGLSKLVLEGRFTTPSQVGRVGIFCSSVSMAARTANQCCCASDADADVGTRNRKRISLSSTATGASLTLISLMSTDAFQGMSNR